MMSCQKTYTWYQWLFCEWPPRGIMDVAKRDLPVLPLLAWEVVRLSTQVVLS